MPSVARVVDAARRLLELLGPWPSTSCRSTLRTCTGTSPASSSRCSRSSRATPSGSRCRTPAGTSAATQPFAAQPGARHRARARRADRGARRACRQVLAVRIDEVAPGSWGVTFGGAAAPDRLGARRTGSGAAAGRSVRLAPFLGVLGMPPAEPGVHSTIPPRRCGGNIDCKELVAGTTLYLPIPVDGALFSAGDGHAAQGDGEVSGTAIEAPVEATADARPARRPRARVAARAHRRRLAHVRLRRAPRAWRRGSPSTGCSTCWSASTASPREDALALASIVVDLRVTQVVNEALGVHAVLRDDAFLLTGPAR